MPTLNWIGKDAVVKHLSEGRQISLPMIVRRRHELAAIVRTMLSDHRRLQSRNATKLLFEMARESVQIDDDYAVTIEEDSYCTSQLYEGSHRFKKHAFASIGAMNGEELECAIRIDDHENVLRWLRNSEYETQGGFSLAKSPGRFFPDFIVELCDGRLVLVEYKMSKLASDPDEIHKKDIGELWAQRSDQGHRFGWVVAKDWPASAQVLSINESTLASKQ